MGVTLTRVHSCFTVHMWSARWHAAHRRARQNFYFYFLATANQRPRLGAALGAAAHPTLLMQKRPCVLYCNYSSDKSSWRADSPRRRGGSLRGGCRGRPHYPHERGGPWGSPQGDARDPGLPIDTEVDWRSRMITNDDDDDDGRW